MRSPADGGRLELNWHYSKNRKIEEQYLVVLLVNITQIRGRLLSGSPTHKNRGGEYTEASARAQTCAHSDWHTRAD